MHLNYIGNSEYKVIKVGYKDLRVYRDVPFWISSPNGQYILKIKGNDFIEVKNAKTAEYKYKCLLRLDNSVGDNLLSVPAFNCLERNLINTKIDIITSKELKYLWINMAGQIFTDIEAINNTKSYDYQYEFTLRGNGKQHHTSKNQDRINVFCNAIGFSLEDEDLSWDKINIEPKKTDSVAVVIKAVSQYRTWDMSLKKQRELIELISQTHKVTVFDNEKHPMFDDMRNVLNLTGDISSKEYIERIAGSKFCIVCGDTSAEHIAGIFGVPFIAMFGVVQPELRISHYNNCYGFYKCDSCGKIPCEQKGQAGCYHGCLDSIKVEDVYNKFCEMVG